MTLFPNAGIESVLHGGLDTSIVRAPASSRCFDGHFDAESILPGIVHFALVLDACARRAGQPLSITAVRDARWKRPIRPGDELMITLTNGADDSVRFSIECGGEVASSGTVVLAADGGHGLA